MPSGSGSQRRFRADRLRQVPGSEVRPVVPKSAGRSDRQFCSHACQMRFRRAGTGGMVN